jgi:CxxC motif-containing protein (DUF1111 family)
VELREQTAGALILRPPLHSMESNLADGLSQGLANRNEFRTPPWGVEQRRFLLHDG